MMNMQSKSCILFTDKSQQNLYREMQIQTDERSENTDINFYCLLSVIISGRLEH